MNWNGYDEINTEGETNRNNLDDEKKFEQWCQW